MSSALISVKSLYDYDNTLFNGFTPPEAMDKTALINYIIAECADLELLITNFDTLKVMIESWSISRKHSWERLYESTVQDYNMIHNYDRYEDWTDTGHGTGTGQNAITNSKAAYNNSSPVLAEKTDSDSTSTTSTSGTHHGHLYGNIGVTTAAQMIQGERDITAYDVYQAIADEFKQKFCIVVY